MRAVVVVALALAACQDKAPPPPPPAPPARPAAPVVAAPSDGGDPWAVVIDAAPDTPERRRARVDEALARVPAIVAKVAGLRKLELRHPVPSAYQTHDDFRKFVEREVDEDLPKGRGAELSAALYYLGFVTKPLDLARAEIDASASQAAAYYDPKQQKFFVVMAPDNELALDTIAAHELTHALQDQHFDLRKYMAKTKPQNSDAELARKFVVEGDATFSMFVYQTAANERVAAMADWLNKIVRSEIKRYAEMAPEDMMEALGGMTAFDPESKQASQAMHELPTIVIVPMLESYFQGAAMVMAVYDHGGWDAVNALFTTPPESTEQVLHPETKLIGKRDHPHAVVVPPIAGATEVDDDVIGELQWSLYFTLWASAARVPASQGWGGDRYWIGKRRDGRLIAAIATIWDTKADAHEFAEAYEISIKARFPPGKPAADGGYPRTGGGQIYLRTAGDKVYIVDGADGPADLDRLVDGATFP